MPVDIGPFPFKTSFLRLTVDSGLQEAKCLVVERLDAGAKTLFQVGLIERLFLQALDLGDFQPAL